MKKLVIPGFLVILLVILLIPFEGRAEDVIKKGEVLNLEKCISIAQKNHPGVIAARNTVNLSHSRTGQAEANYYPQVSLTAGYRKASSFISGTAGSVSVSKSPSGTINQYSSSVSLSQNLYDFGKTPEQVKIQNLNLESSRSDLENVSDQIAFNVRQAYYGVLQAGRNREVAAGTVRQFQKRLEQARGFFDVGTKPKFDVTKAEVDLSNAKLNLIKAENARRITIVNLNNTMGIPGAPDYDIEDNLSFQKYETTFEEVLSAAFRNRHDIKSLITKTMAAQDSVELAKKGYYPAITGNASYNWSGESFPLDHGWNVGATLSFPVFSGYLTKYQVEESRANLDVIRANEALLKQTVFLEVQQAYLNLKEAEERIPAAELTVKQAEENFDIANGRYVAGVGNPIEVTDAEVVLSNAKRDYIQALYDYKIAQASIGKAMGVR